MYLCKLQIMILLYNFNRLRLKIDFVIKLSKLNIKQFYIFNKRQAKPGHTDVPKTFFGTPGHEVQSRRQSQFSGTYGNPNLKDSTTMVINLLKLNK
jgi:hypothetical protein